MKSFFRWDLVCAVIGLLSLSLAVPSGCAMRAGSTRVLNCTPSDSKEYVLNVRMSGVEIVYEINGMRTVQLGEIKEYLIRRKRHIEGMVRIVVHEATRWGGPEVNRLMNGISTNSQSTELSTITIVSEPSIERVVREKVNAMCSEIGVKYKFVPESCTSNTTRHAEGLPGSPKN